MNTDRFLEQFNKSMRKDIFRIGAGISATIALGACAYAQKQGWVDFTPTPNNTPNSTETINPTENAPTIAELPKVGPVYENEVKEFFEGSNCGRAWAEIDVTIPDIGGTFYGGHNFLFNAQDDSGAQRYCLVQAEGKETQLQYGQILGTSQIVFFAEPTGTPDSFGQMVIQKTYFIWDLSEKDELGNTIVTFQSDGTSDTAQNFLLPPTANFGSMDKGLITINYNPETKTISTKSPESQLPPEMTEKYLGKFEKTEQGIKQINEVDTNVIYGIKDDGTKQVIAMEMEIDGEMRMTGVSETTVYDKENNPHNIYVYIDPKWNSSDPDDDRDPSKRWGRFTVNSETANILFGKPEDPKYPIFWNAIATQMGLSVDKTIDLIMREREGVTNFNVPVGEMNKATSYSEMTNLPYPADLNKPIVVRTVFSLDDYNRLPNEIKENRSVVGLDTTDEAYGKFVGGLIWTNPDGQLVIYYISTTIEVFFGLDPEKYSSDNTLSKSAAESISRSIYRLCDIMNDGLMNQVSYYNRSTLKAFDANLTTFR